MFWSLGSIYAKRHPTESSPYVTAAVQMLTGGTVVTLVGTSLGEWGAWHLTGSGALAMGYLVVFGSIVGYSAYGYALRHAPATIVGTYAYVNPVIAVLLGWSFLGESITGRMIVAIGLILAAVVWIQLSHKALSAFGGPRSADARPSADSRPPQASSIRPEEAA